MAPRSTALGLAGSLAELIASMLWRLASRLLRRSSWIRNSVCSWRCDCCHASRCSSDNDSKQPPGRKCPLDVPSWKQTASYLLSLCWTHYKISGKREGSLGKAAVLHTC